jgi:hypothetical protein
MTTLKIRDRTRVMDKSSNSLLPMLSNSVAEFKQATIVPLQYAIKYKVLSNSVYNSAVA